MIPLLFNKALSACPESTVTTFREISEHQNKLEASNLVFLHLTHHVLFFEFVCFPAVLLLLRII